MRTVLRVTRECGTLKEHMDHIESHFSPEQSYSTEKLVQKLKDNLWRINRVIQIASTVLSLGLASKNLVTQERDKVLQAMRDVAPMIEEIKADYQQLFQEAGDALKPPSVEDELERLLRELTSRDPSSQAPTPETTPQPPNSDSEDWKMPVSKPVETPSVGNTYEIRNMSDDYQKMLADLDRRIRESDLVTSK